MYLSDLVKKNGGNIQKALAQYNGGSDPQYVQNVEKHLPLYGGLPRPHSEAVAGGASGQERATIQYYDSEINKLQKKIDTLAPIAMTPAGKGVLERFDTKLKTLMAERERIEKRYEGQPTARLRETAERLFPGTPYTMLSGEQRQAVATAAPEMEAEDAGLKAGAEAKATEESKIKVSAAQGAIAADRKELEQAHLYLDENKAPARVATVGQLLELNQARQEKNLPPIVKWERLKESEPIYKATEEQLSGIKASKRVLGYLNDPKVARLVGTYLSNP